MGKIHFSSHRKNDISASVEFGNSERIESISYVLVNDDYHLILIDDRPNKTMFELSYGKSRPNVLHNTIRFEEEKLILNK